MKTIERCEMCNAKIKNPVYLGSGVCRPRCDKARIAEMQEVARMRRRKACRARNKRSWHQHVSKVTKARQKGTQR